MNNNITIAEIIAIKGGTISELCQYASSKGIKLPNDPTYVLSSSELNAIDPMLAYKLKWGVTTARKSTNKTDGNKPKEFLEAAQQNKRKLTKAQKREKIAQQRSRSEAYDIRIGLKKPKRPRMTRTPNPQIELKRASVTAFTEIMTTADVDAAVECFIWPSPEYNRKNDFFVQKLIGQNEALLNYYHKKMKAYFGIEHVLEKDYELKQNEREKYWFEESDYNYQEEDVEEEITNEIEADEEPENNIDSIDFDALVKGLNESTKRMADESIHELNKRKRSSPVSSKKSPRVIKLPQPIAQLACSGLLENIETSYLGTWRPGEVPYTTLFRSTQKMKLPNS